MFPVSDRLLRAPDILNSQGPRRWISHVYRQYHPSMEWNYYIVVARHTDGVRGNLPDAPRYLPLSVHSDQYLI